VDWSEEVYERIRGEYNAFVSRLGFADIHFFPICALHGDNVVESSENLPWYDGATLLHHMESVNIASDRNLIDMRFPVQYVVRPNLDFRGFSGTVASGVVRQGDAVMSLPSRQTSNIKSVLLNGEEVTEAFAPMAVTVTLEDEIDVSRGDMLAPVNNLPTMGNEIEAMVVWMHDEPARQGRSYLIKQTTNLVPGVLTNIRYKMDINNLRKEAGDTDSLDLNDFGRTHITLHRPIAFDPYERNRSTGSFIIIDRVTNVTVGAGMIIDRVVRDKTVGPKSQNIAEARGSIVRADRESLLGQSGHTIWLTGFSGSGKSTIAYEVERQLMAAGRLCIVLDGDNVRHGLNRDLGFSANDRTENIRRIAEVARLMNSTGVITITSFISPYIKDRQDAREIIGSDHFMEVHLDTPLEVCEARDPKGLYKKVRAGEIPQFTGITDPYEAPEDPELRLATESLSAEDCAKAVVAMLEDVGVLGKDDA
jgi:bifunctional enzyme CysN/CysC